MVDLAGGYLLPGSQVFDLEPSAGGEPYRIFLFIPSGSPPVSGWPLLVLTDGNATFPFACASLMTQAPYPTSTNIGWGVVAAIGYPSDEPYDGMRRSWDLTSPPGQSYPPYHEGGPPVITGGADKFLAFIEHDLLPRLAEMTVIDDNQRTLFGHSFGGRFTLFSLFERPHLFSRWVAASPTIYWEESSILKYEAQRHPGSGVERRLYLSAGQYEGDMLAPFQHRNDDAAYRIEMKRKELTVSLAMEMAERLKSTSDGIQASFELYTGETHMSALAVAISRAVAIAFAIHL